MLYRLCIIGALIVLPLTAAAQVTEGVSSYANSGGNTAGEGGVTQTGTSNASVYVETSSGSGSSVVHIETSNNGVSREETYTATGSLGVMVTATASGTQTRVWTPTTTGAGPHYFYRYASSAPQEASGTQTIPPSFNFSTMFRWVSGLFSSPATSSATSTQGFLKQMFQALTHWF